MCWGREAATNRWDKVVPALSPTTPRRKLKKGSWRKRKNSYTEFPSHPSLFPPMETSFFFFFSPNEFVKNGGKEPRPKETKLYQPSHHQHISYLTWGDFNIVSNLDLDFGKKISNFIVYLVSSNPPYILLNSLKNHWFMGILPNKYC